MGLTYVFITVTAQTNQPCSMVMSVLDTVYISRWGTVTYMSAIMGHIEVGIPPENLMK